MAMAPVTIVVLPDFGGRLAALAAAGPVWIADSTMNRAETEKRWRAGLRDVTTFKISEPLDPEEAAGGILGQVLLHHPSTREIRVIGCRAGARLRATFQAEGFDISEESNDSFTARSRAVA